jgi:tRNA 5-methylaminomethyl-2-thiouridine biosynthesis bifunctional protein
MGAARRVWLQSGFGRGEAFLRAWAAWRDDPDRAARLDCIALTSQPPQAADLVAAHRGALEPLARALAARWPPLTRNLHRLTLDGGHCSLLLAPGPLRDTLPELRAQVDHFVIDELPDPADPPRSARAMARLAAPLAQLQSAVDTPAWRHALASAGFEPMPPGNRGPLQAVYRPRFTPRRRPAAVAFESAPEVVIVGAGLAGCALAGALAEQGWPSLLLDSAAAPAMAASGNPAGLFHGVVHGDDAPHARLHRAAAMRATRAVQDAIESGQAQGSTAGVLRLDTRGREVAALQAELQALGLPEDYAQALSPAQAHQACGLPLSHPAWYFPGGGWVQPAALAQSYLARAGAAVRFRGGVTVQSLARQDGRWLLLGADGRTLATADVVVLANANAAPGLAGLPAGLLQPVRGQLSWYRQHEAPVDRTLQLPRLPLAGAGYLLPQVQGLAVFGATSQVGDDTAELRPADQAANLQRLMQLCPAVFPTAGLVEGLVGGRVGWRCQSPDRLPLIGAVPEAGAAPAERLEQVPRRPGLYLFTALGSRGIAWSAFGAELLAAQLTGAPWPLEASLVRALDPVRFLRRRA